MVAVAAIIRAWQSAWKLARQEMDKSVQVVCSASCWYSRPDDSMSAQPLSISGADRNPSSHDFVGIVYT